jgi:hypothetical protein
MAGNKNWSENQEGRHRGTEDIMLGVGLGVDSLDIVAAEALPHGARGVYDCSHCGRQTDFFTPWPEMACYYRGRPIKGTAPTNQGMFVRMRCPRCNRISKIIWPWTEVDSLVREAVRLRRLPPEVLLFERGR